MGLHGVRPEVLVPIKGVIRKSLKACTATYASSLLHEHVVHQMIMGEWLCGLLSFAAYWRSGQNAIAALSSVRRQGQRIMWSCEEVPVGSRSFYVEAVEKKKCGSNAVCFLYGVRLSIY